MSALWIITGCCLIHYGVVWADHHFPHISCTDRGSHVVSPSCCCLLCLACLRLLARTLHVCFLGPDRLLQSCLVKQPCTQTWTVFTRLNVNPFCACAARSLGTLCGCELKMLGISHDLQSRIGISLTTSIMTKEHHFVQEKHYTFTLFILTAYTSSAISVPTVYVQ